jgi:predicted DNA-binding protein with PD1-like motif
MHNMTFRHDGFNWIVRLERGEKLVESLMAFVRDHGVPSCWVNGLGAASSVELGYYQLDQKTYAWKSFDQLLEIVSLQGNIVGQLGDPKVHLHGVFSDQNYQTLGGHVRELTVGGTCEIMLHRWQTDRINRSLDTDTGLNLLDI